MKPKHWIIVILLIAMGFSEALLAQNKKHEVTGTWTFDYQASMAKLTKKSEYSSIDARRKDILEMNYKGRTLTLGLDGSYSQLFFNGRQIAGSWTFSSNGKDIIVTNANGESCKLKVKEVSSTQMVLKPEPEKGKNNMMVSEWFLTKN